MAPVASAPRERWPFPVGAGSDTPYFMSYNWKTCDLAGPMRPGCEERQVPAGLASRPAPPDDVFCWPLVDTWRARVWAMLADIVTDEVKAAFVENPPEHVVSDDLSWLDDIVSEVTGIEIDIKQLTAARLATEWRAFRAAHATRTDDVCRFYREGLRLLRADDAERRARDLLLDGRFGQANEERLAAAIEDVGARAPVGGREGRLYFCADESSLVTRRGGSGHYLVYGGEYLYCLAIRTVGTLDARRVLKSVGRPTMFLCDIPMPRMRHETLLEFAGSILEYLFCELVEGLEARALSPGAGSALSLAEDLPGEYIVGHYHPVAVENPL